MRANIDASHGYHASSSSSSPPPLLSTVAAPGTGTQPTRIAAVEGTSTSHHIVWGAISSNSGSNSTNSETSSSRGQKQRRDKCMDGALLVAVSNSSSNSSLASRKSHKSDKSHASSVKSHESGVLDDRGIANEFATTKHVLDDRGSAKEVGAWLNSLPLPLSRADQNVLRRLSREQLSPNLPRDVEGNLLSVGSINHAIGKCSPCALAVRAKGCKQDIFCLFCHYSDHPEKKAAKCRPSKNQRLRYRNCLERLEGHMRETGDIKHEELADSLHISKTRSAIKTGIGKLSL